VNLLRRKSPEAAASAEDVVDKPGGKGRPTPKRRTHAAPVTSAPRTRKEAIAWQKQQRKSQKGVAGQKKLSPTEYRELMKKGDPRVLPRRDQGELRQLARDYVDSRRMLSNYLLLLFPFMLLGTAFPPVQIGVLAAFFAILAEWFVAARGIKKMAAERDIAAREGNLTLAMYAGARSYFPRSWRRPAPRFAIGDKI